METQVDDRERLAEQAGSAMSAFRLVGRLEGIGGGLVAMLPQQLMPLRLRGAAGASPCRLVDDSPAFAHSGIAADAAGACVCTAWSTSAAFSAKVIASSSAITLAGSSPAA